MVAGERHTRELKGMVLEDPEEALGPGVRLPPPNPHVVLDQELTQHARNARSVPRRPDPGPLGWSISG